MHDHRERALARWNRRPPLREGVAAPLALQLLWNPGGESCAAAGSGMGRTASGRGKLIAGAVSSSIGGDASPSARSDMLRVDDRDREGAAAALAERARADLWSSVIMIGGDDPDATTSFRWFRAQKTMLGIPPGRGPGQRAR